MVDPAGGRGAEARGTRRPTRPVVALVDADDQRVGAHRVGSLRLQPLVAAVRERHLRGPVDAGELPAHAGAGDGRAVLAVHHLDRERLAGLRGRRAGELQQVGLGEVVVGEQDVVPWRHLLLAASDVRALVVERVAPELRAVAGVGTDPVDREVLEAVEPGPGPGEAAGDRAVVQRGGHRGTGRGIGAAVGPVAGVRAAGVLGQGLRVGGHRTLEYRRGASLDPEVHGHRAGQRRRGGGEHGQEEQRDPQDRAAREMLHQSHPFPRGLSGLWPEAGLLAPGPTLPRLPGPPSAAQWLHASRACGGRPR